MGKIQAATYDGKIQPAVGTLNVNNRALVSYGVSEYIPPAQQALALLFDQTIAHEAKRQKCCTINQSYIRSEQIKILSIIQSHTERTNLDDASLTNDAPVIKESKILH